MWGGAQSVITQGCVVSVAALDDMYCQCVCCCYLWESNVNIINMTDDKYCCPMYLGWQVTNRRPTSHFSLNEYAPRVKSVDEAAGAETEAAGVYRIRRIVTPTLGELFLILVLPIYGGVKPPSIAYRSRKRATLVPISRISERTGTGANAASSWRHQLLREPRGGKGHASTNGGTPIYT
jgi:hypothetical protein